MSQKKFDLEGTALARNTDPSESRLAALSTREKAQALERIVLRSLARQPGTSHDIAADTKLGYESVTPRIRPLRSKRLVESRWDENGLPVRKYHSAAPSRVWFITPKGRQSLL